MLSLTRIPLMDFDVQVLAPEARVVGSPAFRDAVVLYLSEDYAKNGRCVLATVDEQDICVMEFVDTDEALNYLLPALNKGQLAATIPQLESLTRGHAPNPRVLYNLGIAYSELQQFDEAVIRLKRAVQLDPSFNHAWVGIGTAYERMGKLDLALPALETAATLAPDDGYAQRNLGALYGELGRPDEALAHLRRAVDLMPDDAGTLYGLALTLSAAQRDDETLNEEADALFRQFLDRFPEHPLAEDARTHRTTFAQKQLRSVVGGALRMDVVFYIVGALQRFATVGPKKRDEIALEIAIMGRSGLDIHDSRDKYTLKTIPEGRFTGLHLLALMYTAFKEIDPKVETGADFRQEYEVAKSLHQRETA